MTELTGQVLVVEDQDLWREQFFSEPLRDLGLKTFTAATKAEALALLDQHHFDLAIVDINLTAVIGNIDGLAVIDRLLDSGSPTPVIIVSGSDEAIRIAGEPRYHVFAKIQKGLFNLEDFIAQVKLALGQN